MSNKTTARITIIDSFRGIAALSVIFFHVFNRLGYNESNIGLTGVDLFFIISGFVIFLTLSKCDSWKVFVASRIARLYPVYWACVTITALLIFSQSGLSNNLTGSYLINLTMFQHYFKVPNLDFPYWTLTVEMQFYILMLFLFQTSLLNKTETAGIAICVFIIIYGTLIRTYLPSIFHFMNNAFPLLNHFPLFFAGILFYKLKFENNKKITIWILLSVCFALAIYQFDFNERYKFLPDSQYIYALTVYFLLFALYVIKEELLSVLKPFVFFGTISYSLYLIHQYVSFNIILPFLKEHLADNLLVASICIVSLIVAATIITFGVEKPSLQSFRLFLLKLFHYNTVKNNK